MASRPVSKSTGNKRLQTTYGSSSRTRHSNPRDLDAPRLASPRKPQSSATGLTAGPSLEAASLERRSTDARSHAAEGQAGRKRKRNDSAAFAVKPVADLPSRGLERRLPRGDDTDTPKKASSVAISASAPALSRSTAEHGASTTSRRRRLIDALAAQRAASPVHADEEVTHLGTGEEAGRSTPRQTVTGHDLPSSAADRRAATPTSRKIKLTYSQSRSILSESQGRDDLEPPGLDAEDDTQALSSPMAPTFAEYDVEDDCVSQPAIKSVHELRRAGANNRFADEMDDLLARIGSPGAGSLTMRRNALCELAHSLPRESFAGQFRDHASRDNVAKGVGREEDVISGFALAAALVIFLKSGPAPHLLRQLSKEGVGKLLGRLLRVSEEIDALASQRKINLPPTTKASVRGVKETLVKMPIWHGFEPTHLSPRTLGLQLLETISRCSDGQLLELVVGDFEKDLVSIAANCAEASAKADVVDYALVVISLQVLSSAGITPGAMAQGAWMERHPRSIATFLQRALQRWPSQRGEPDAAVLKLAINTTNTERGTAAFDSPDLLSLLADRIKSGLRRAQDAIGSGQLADDMYDELLLILGVTINIVEHSPPARTSVGDKALDDLVALWQENRLAVSEADSVDKSRVSVAVGYLAVLLGYLCLTRKGRERVRARVGSGEGLRSLVGSIRDFVVMYKTVDGKVHELEALVSELRRHDAQAR